MSIHTSIQIRGKVLVLFALTEIINCDCPVSDQIRKSGVDCTLKHCALVIDKSFKFTI